MYVCHCSAVSIVLKIHKCVINKQNSLYGKNWKMEAAVGGRMLKPNLKRECLKVKRKKKNQYRYVI